MSTQGSAIVDFGSTGKTDSSVAVTGQGAFVAGTSLVEAWIVPIQTATNMADNHWVEELGVPNVILPITGTGFTITLRCLKGVAFGQYNLSWCWN